MDAKTLYIRVTRPFYFKGVYQPVGKEMDYPFTLALETINSGKAERAVKPEPTPDPKPAPEPPKATAKKAKE